MRKEPTMTGSVEEAAAELEQLARRLRELDGPSEADLCIDLSIRLRDKPAASKTHAPAADRSLTPAEAAKLLGLSQDVVRGLIRCGALPGYGLGRNSRVPRRAAEAYLASAATAPEPDLLFSAAEAARWLGVDRKEVYNLRQAGKLHATKNGAGALIRLSELRRCRAEWLRSQA